jgi:YjbE family integral membrane protein
MQLLFTSFFWVTLAEIVMVNIMLSGDNAVVIALASRSLPPKQQKLAILYGSMGAILLRILLTFFAVMLLDVPTLKIIGAALLVWIAIRMLLPEQEEKKLDAQKNLIAAIKTIIVADLIMSMDNVLGVAAAAKGNTVMLVIGLTISIPLIVYGSTLIVKLMERFGFIVILGAGLLGWVAGEMLITDPTIATWAAAEKSWTHLVVPLSTAAIVMLAGSWLASTAATGEAVPASPFMPQVALAGTNGLVPDENLRYTADNRRSLAVSAKVAGFAAQGPGTAVPFPGDHPAQALAETAATDLTEPEAPPPGYRWVTQRWKSLPGGKRDYAVLHGMQTFRRLAPVSSRLRGPRL